jgi:hypothetical protein
MSVNRNHVTDSQMIPLAEAHDQPATAAEVQGYALGLPGPLAAPEPPPGTTGGSVGEADWDGTDDRERPAVMMPVRGTLPGLRFFTLGHW